MSLKLLDVIRVAKHFSNEAGWPYFKLHSVKQIDELKWEILADVGPLAVKMMRLVVDEASNSVITFEPWTDSS